ncbi:MAG: hypothetical protein ACM31C_24045 [Acidobacteriota bacterium]
MRLALLIVAVPVLAGAKPLPAGLEIGVVHKHLTASAGGESVALSDHDVDKLGSVALSADGKQLEIAATFCSGMFGSIDDGPLDYPLAPIQAQLENLAGMRAHLKKKYADAIPHFAAAAKLDPATALYATNLLSAQAMAGKLADADHTLATYAPNNLPWFAWRLQVDSDLKALRGRPSTKLLAAPRRGRARSKLARLPAARILYSPLGLAATELEYNMYDGIPDGSGDFQLVIVDLKTGKELLTLPTESTCAVDMEKAMAGDADPPPADKKCAAKEAAAAVPRRKVADELLATLGFEAAGVTVDDSKKELVAPDGRKLVFDTLTFTKGKKSKQVKIDSRGFDYAFVPGALVVVTRDGKTVKNCDADGSYRLQLAAIADP